MPFPRTLSIAAGLLATAVCFAAADAPPSEHGLDLAGTDTAVAPGDDFFAYANGTWVKNTEIPADRSSFGSFAVLAEQAGRRTQELIQQAANATTPSAEARQVGDYYAAFMDEATIESRGTKPIQPLIAAIDEVVRDDAFGNAERASLFAYRQALARLARPVDRSDWWMTPQTVNAVNLPLQNALNFPAAILDRPFFDAGTDAAQNYGGIGVVIGHEISHSFDDQGSRFDVDGRLANWWTPADADHFQKAAARLVAQYDAYEPLPGVHVNGKLTLSENIADVAGVSAAFDGYRAANGGKEGPSAQGLRGDRRFFLSFGQIWCTKFREPALRNQIVTDGHSPGMYRAATVRNVDAWYAAFGVTAGRLFLAPEDRVRIW